jgi:hypothetical protein
MSDQYRARYGHQEVTQAEKELMLIGPDTDENMAEIESKPHISAAE